MLVGETAKRQAVTNVDRTIASVKRQELTQELNLPASLEILLVLALGKPKEQVVVEALGADGSVKYWRDAAQVHHVPKRALDDLIINH